MLVRVMQRLEERHCKPASRERQIVELDPGVDLRLSPDRFDSDDELLVARARRWLPAHHHLPEDLEHNLDHFAVRWLPAIVSVTFGMISGLSSTWFTDRDHQVQVFWFVSIVSIQFLLLVPAAVFLVFQGWQTRHSKHADPATKPFGFLNLILAVFVGGFVRCMLWLARCIPGATSQRAKAGVEHDHGLGWKAIAEVLFESHALRLKVAMSLHLFWLTALSLALIGLGWRTAGDQYKFSWRSTWIDAAAIREVSNFVAAIGPANRLFAKRPIDEAAVDYLRKSPEQLEQEEREWRLKQEELELPLDDISKRWEQRRLEIQQSWLCTLVDFILLLAVLPRALVLAPTILLWKRERDAECRVDLDDPYCLELLALLRKTGPKFVPGSPQPESQSVLTNLPAERTPMVEPPAVPAVNSLRTSKRLWIAGYNLDPPTADVLALPPELAGVTWVGELNGMSDRDELLRDIGRTSGSCRLVLFVRALMTPDKTVVGFLRDTHNGIAEPHGLLVVLTELDVLRVNFDNDLNKVRARLNLWVSKCREAGLEEGDCLEFDHLTLTAASRDLLARRLADWYAGNVHLERKRHWAGKLPAAFDAISRFVDERPDMQSRDDTIALTHEIHKTLSGIYCGDRPLANPLDLLQRALPRRLEQARDEIRNAIGDFADDHAEGLPEVWKKQVRGLLAWWKILQQVNWRWSVAGGILCSVAAPVGVLAVAGLSGLPLVMPVALFGGLGGIVTAATAQTTIFDRLRTLLARSEVGDTHRPTSPGARATIGLDELIRSSVLWALVLELQGTPEDVLVDTLNSLTSGIDQQIEDITAAKGCLEQIQRRYQQLRTEG